MVPKTTSASLYRY